MCDVFISAGQQQMERLDEQGMLLGGSGVNLLENQVVLAIRRLFTCFTAVLPPDLPGSHTFLERKVSKEL